MELARGRQEMTIHRDMYKNSGNKPGEQTMHRVYVEFEDGYFIVLGMGKEFQEMVNEMGRPTKVEFRATDEGWHVEGDGTVWTCVEGS